MKNSYFISIVALALIVTLSCAPTFLRGEWRVQITYLASDNTTSQERFVLRFDKEGNVYKNNKFYGRYEFRANKRFKFFSQDRKLVFYGELISKNRIEGEGLHIPNDQIFARWTGERK